MPIENRVDPTSTPFLPPSTARSLTSKRSKTNLSQRLADQPSSSVMDETNFLNTRIQNVRLGSTCPRLLLDFIVVGGGIAGLASAYSLARSGHCVHLLERASSLLQRAGGIRVPPNLTKILVEWGLHETVQTALRCRKSQFLSFETGEVVGILEWQEDIMHEAGADFLIMHHNDLQETLYNIAVAAGVMVSFGTSVERVGFDHSKRQPFVVLPGGKRLSADVVLGADGFRSVVRKFVAPEADHGVDTGHSFFTVTIPTSEMRKDPDLSEFASLSEWPIWMGPSRSALGYPIRGGEEYSLHVYWPDAELRDTQRMDEAWDVTVPTTIIDFEGYDSRVQRMFNLSPTALRTRIIRREIAEDWLDESGRILLIGEAAHPLLPCTMQNYSLAVEDAAVLGSLMSHLSSRTQIPQLLEAFREVRHARCVQVHDSEYRNAMLVTLPSGSPRDERDASFRRSLQANITTWDDTMLREQWDEIGEVFGYNAREAAEDWWVKWGALGSARDLPVYKPLELMFKVTSVSISET